MADENQSTWRNNIKLIIGMLGSAVVFGNLFYGRGYNDATNDGTREKQEFFLRLMEQRDNSIRDHAEDENNGARADQERADACIIEQMRLRDEIILLKSKLGE